MIHDYDRSKPSYDYDRTFLTYDRSRDMSHTASDIPEGYDADEWDDMDEDERGRALTELTTQQSKTHASIRSWINRSKVRAPNPVPKYRTITTFATIDNDIRDDEHGVVIGFEANTSDGSLGDDDQGQGFLTVEHDNARYSSVHGNKTFDLSKGADALVDFLADRQKVFTVKLKVLAALFKHTHMTDSDLGSDETLYQIGLWEPGKDPTKFLKQFIKDTGTDPATLPELVKVVKKVRS